MSVEQVLSFKLSDKGVLESVPKKVLLENFTSIGVLVFYTYLNKRLYVWIGKSVPESIKKYISNIEQSLLKMNTGKQFDREITILRHFTIEEGHERADVIQNFFTDIGLEEPKVKDQLKKWEEYQISIYGKIQKVDIESNNYYMVSEFDKAIESTLEVITLAEKIKNDELIERKKQFIEELKQLKELQKNKIAAKKEVETLGTELLNHITSGDVEKANGITVKMRALYKDLIKSEPISKHKELFAKSDALFDAWKKKQEELKKKEMEIKQNIEKIKKEIERNLERNEFDVALKLKENFKQELAKIADTEVIGASNNYIEDLDSRVKKLKEILALKNKIDNGLAIIKTYTNENQFEKAIEDIDMWIDLAKKNWLDTYLTKLEQIKEDILHKKYDFDREANLIDRLINLVKESSEKGQYAVAMANCEKLIEVAIKIKRHDLKEEYSDLLAKLIKKKNLKKMEEDKEREELLKRAQEAEKFIDREKGVLPFVEDYSISDLLGNLSDNVNDMLNQLSSLLEEHRVEIKQEVKSTNTMKSVTGEVVAVEKTVSIVQKEAEGDQQAAGKSVKFSFQSTLENPFNDAIDEAIIQDLIPYNYEITELKINGEISSTEPEQILGKDGLEVKWTLHNIPPKEKVNIDYDLRRRVSRTIILPMVEQLKIIKTHSSLNPLDVEGLFNAKLRFSNKFETSIKGVVIEDIVPTLYIYDIKEPTEIPETKAIQVNGSLVKWFVNNVPVNYTNIYNYQLLEIYKFEQLKIDANTFSAEALEDLEKGKISVSLEKFNKIVQFLNDYK
jgi:tetratricopeptide (TPR) repeat protein